MAGGLGPQGLRLRQHVPGVLRVDESTPSGNHHQRDRQRALTHDPDYICGVTGNAALTAFTQSLGSESVRDGVRVVAVSPGPVATERLVNLMRKKAQDRTGNAENWRDLFKPLPFERAATAEEIGAAIAFLASEHSGYTSGSIAVIDAGLSARSQSF
jgi:hypothetical protein